MSKEKYLLKRELATICKKPLPNIVSVNSLVYVSMWPNYVSVLYDSECWKFLYYSWSRNLHLEL